MTRRIDGSALSLAKNAVSQVGGRIALSLGRLLVALIIVHASGAASFGAYALILQFVVLFEAISDFGQTDTAVRDACQTPQQEAEILRSLATLKLLQGMLLSAVLPALLYVMAYPAELVRAGAIGGVAVLSYALVQVYRARLRLQMRMERDVAAELIGLAVMLPLTWWACETGAGIEVLVGCYSLSRLLFLGAIVALASADARSFRPSDLDGGRQLFRRALPLGTAGLLVSLYDSLATVLISKLAAIDAVAQYAAAVRFVFPMIIVVQALGAAFYPPLAAAWKVMPARFRELQQTALELSIFLGGGLFSGVFAGAAFLMALMGPTIGAAAPLLQLLSVTLLARSVTTAMSPLIIIAGRAERTLWLTAMAIALQIVAIIVLVPMFGIIGAAAGYLVIEIVASLIPISLIGQAATGARVSWGQPLRLIACAGGAVTACAFLPLEGTIWSGIMGGVLYLALAVATGTMPISRLRLLAQDLLAQRRSGRSPEAGQP